MKTEILTACDQVVAAMANGVYQGAILTLLVALGLKWFGRSNAATRHGVWLATLVLLLALIPAHYWLEQHGSVPQAPAPEAISSGNPAISSITSLAPGSKGEGAGAVVPWLPRVPGFEHRPLRFQERQEPEAALPFINLSAQPGTGSSNFPRLETTIEPTVPLAPLDQVPKQSYPRPGRLLKQVTWNLASGCRLPRLTGAVLVGAWFALAAFRMALLMRRIYQLRKLRACSMPARPEVEDLFQRLTRQLGVGRKVEIRVSPAHRCPVVLGFLHPVILLPAAEATCPNKAGTEPILRHELAHVRRGDHWANLIQHCVQATCFFHPAVWWVSRQLVLEREIACDDHVLEQGARRRAYALLLAELAARMKRCPPLPAPGAFTNKSQLKQRINMILDTRRNTSPRLAKTRLGFITSAAALLALLALYSAPRLVLAQTHTATASAAAASQTAVAFPPPAAAEAASVLSEEDPPSIPGEESGPKFKPDVPVAPPAPRALPAQPRTPTTLPAVAAAPTPPTPPTAPVPLGLLAAPASPVGLQPLGLLAAPAGPADMQLLGSMPVALEKLYAQTPRKSDDVEQRLQRLERMVQSLMVERRPKAAQANNPPCNMTSVNSQEMEELKKMTGRKAAEAAQQAKAASEDAKRASKDLERALKEKNTWAFGMHQDSSQLQLDALRQARQDLQREMQRLDAEIRRLEQERRRLEQEQRRLEQETKPAPEHRGRNKPRDGQTSDDETEPETQ